MSENQKHIFILILVILPVIFFHGCSFLDTYDKIRQFEKHPFIFPDNLTIIKNGEVQISWNGVDSLPLFVIYIDSTECSDCHLNHVNHYNRLLEISKGSRKFDIICVISPSYDQRNSLLVKLLNNNKQTKITYAIDKVGLSSFTVINNALALASEPNERKDCYNRIYDNELKTVFYCGTCSMVRGDNTSFSGKSICVVKSNKEFL